MALVQSSRRSGTPPPEAAGDGGIGRGADHHVCLAGGHTFAMRVVADAAICWAGLLGVAASPAIVTVSPINSLVTDNTFMIRVEG